MIDERTLAATLRELGRDAAVPPEPAAAARRRANRIRRRRLATGAALTAAVLVVGVGTALRLGRTQAGPAWSPADRPTSKVLTVRTHEEGGLSYRTVLYLHGDALCTAVLDVTKAPMTRCDPPGTPEGGVGIDPPISMEPLIGRIWGHVTNVEATVIPSGDVPARIVTVPGTGVRAYVIDVPAGRRVAFILGDSERSLYHSRVFAAEHGPAQSSDVVAEPLPDHSFGALHREVYWRGRDFCADVVAQDLDQSHMTESGCAGVDQTERVAPGELMSISDSLGVGLLGTVERGTARVVATLRGGRGIAMATVLDGYGFPLPLFLLAGYTTADVASVASYDAAGHLIDRHAP